MSTPPVRVTLGKQGRVVIPMPHRRALGLQPGDELVARVEDGLLVLEPRASAITRLRARFQHVQGSMADALLKERREEAAREAVGDPHI